MRPVLWKLARRSGLLRAWRRKNRYRIGILAAHGVMDDGNGASWRPLWRRLHVEHFERTLRLLQRYYEFVSLSEAAQMLKGDLAPRPHCMVLTFDDGYRNNFTHALPVLERLRIPATFFVCPGLIGTRGSYWIDRLDYVIQHLPRQERIIPVRTGGIALNFQNRELLASSYLQLRLALKRNYQSDLEQRVDELAAELEREAGVRLADVIEHDPWAATMSWDESRLAKQRGAEIGSHTVDHVRLSLAEPDTVWDQLTRSRSAIESELGVACTSLAYPNGDYTPAVAAAAQQAGYACAVTALLGLNGPGEDLFTLRRITFPMREHPDHILGLASGFQAAVAELRGRKAG